MHRAVITLYSVQVRPLPEMVNLYTQRKHESSGALRREKPRMSKISRIKASEEKSK